MDSGVGTTDDTVGGDRSAQEDARFRLAVEASPAAMIMVDDRGEIVLVNQQAEWLFGYDRQTLLGQPVEILVPSPSRARHPKLREEFLGHPASRPMGERRELYARRHDGTLFPVEIGLNPIESGGQTLTLASVLDISERVASREAIQRKHRALRRSNQDLEHFAYVVSHDLQEPLRTMRGFLQLLQHRYEGKIDEEAHSFISYAVDGAERMNGMIMDLLSFARIDTGATAREYVSMSAVVEDATNSLLAAIEDSDARIEQVELPMVRGDRTQLALLMQNLIGNSIKYRSEAPPEIHISGREHHDEWRFSLTDNGMGIDPEFHAAIFQVFRRLHPVDEYGGNGIGLALCRRIVEAHGGRIWVDSQPGRGATFHFTLAKVASHRNASASP